MSDLPRYYGKGPKWLWHLRWAWGDGEYRRFPWNRFRFVVTGNSGTLGDTPPLWWRLRPLFLALVVGFVLGKLI